MYSEDKGILLDEPLNIGDLVRGGNQFNVDTNFQEYADNELFDVHDEDDSELNAEIVSPWTSSFNDLRPQMVKLTNNMFKRVMREGTGPLVQKNCRVTVDYNAFLENKQEAFDSTYLRGKSSTFVLNPHSTIPGFFNMITTMQKGEISQFVISHRIFYGELGCLPRIPPKADALFIMTLHSFNECGNIDAVEDVAQEDRTDFNKILAKAIEVLHHGKDMFAQHNIDTAIRAFLKAVESLEFCNLKNEDEQHEQVAILVRLYTNLEVCYNKKELYPKTCLMAKEVRRLCDINQNAKALFHEGRAQRMLGNFLPAKAMLKRCAELEPKNAQIAIELKKLNKKKKEYEEGQIEFSRQAMQNLDFSVQMASTKQVDNINDSEYENIMSMNLLNFRNSDIQQFELPDSLTPEETAAIKSMLVGPYEQLELSTTIINGHKKYKLIKKQR